MDSRKKKIFVVLSVASVVLVWRVYVVIAKYLPKSAQAETAVVAGEETAGLQSQAACIAENRLAERWTAQMQVADGPWGLSPFADKPWAAQVLDAADEPEKTVEVRHGRPSPPAIRFTGASKSGEQWLAIVGDNILRVGDTVDGDFTVAEITKQSITFASGSWMFTYQLGSEEAVIRSRGGDQ
ncbi:MAG: hypothetical protein ABII12_08115 [Planctomycetota bacterium]